MAQVSGVRRIAAVVLSGALLAAAAPAVSAMPFPMNKDVGVRETVETVQYRRRGPVRVVRRGNNGAAAAAAAIGALAIGAAAIAASQPRERVYYDYGYAPPPPPPVYYRDYSYATPGYAYAPPAYGYVPPRRSRWARSQQQIDGGSPYAIQQQRVQNRINRRYAPGYGNTVYDRYGNPRPAY